MKSNLLKIAYEHFNVYSSALQEDQDLTAHEIRAQLCRINHFLVYLGTEYSGSDNVFTDQYRRDDVLKEYKVYSRRSLKSTANTLNTTIESVDRFFQFVGLPPTRMQPDTPELIRPLTDDQAYRINTFCQDKLAPRERSLVYLLMYAGLLPQQCAGLDLNDVRIGTTAGHAMIGIGAARKQVDLEPRCRMSMREYLQDRAERFPFPDQQCFFIDDRGYRLQPAGVDLVVRKIGAEAGIPELTARVLQTTFQYQDAMRQNNVLLASELASGTAAFGLST